VSRLAPRIYGCLAAAIIALPVAMSLATTALAGGASPYLPLNLSPEIERKIERVLILGGEPLLTRPVPIARVMQALPRACERDARLCAQVRHYLDRYFQTAAVTHSSAELDAANSASRVLLPNQHGEPVNSLFDVSSVASYRPFDNLLLSAGGVGYGGQGGGRFNWDGTMLSLGDEYMQLDAGYRDQWLSPLTDSSMLISTAAPAMPSLTLSNQMPIGSAGFEYQLFLARMSYSDRISWQGQYTAGDPRLMGMHFGFSPLQNWSIAGNALYQFGGGARPGSLTTLLSNLFRNTALGTGTTNANGLTTATDTRFANRAISITSAYTFEGPTPVRTYLEYAARDTLHGELYRFHETALSAGVHIPELLRRFDLTLELSEWQNGWYTDYVWQNGLTEDGDVIGNWGADWRTFSNSAGARSAMAQLGFALDSGDLIDVRLRMLENEGYGSITQRLSGLPAYGLAGIATLEYAQPRNGYTRGLSLDAGRDQFGAGIVRLGAFVRFDGGDQGGAAAEAAADESAEESDETTSPRPGRFERFVDLGVSGGRLGLDLGGFSRTNETAPLQNQSVLSPHVGLGLRAAVSAHNDVGVRLDLDDFKGLMLGLRMLDYRYRVNDHLAVGAFVGMARYSAPTPAQGFYLGAGIQWLNVWRQWDLTLEERYFDALQRDKVLPSDAAALAATGNDPTEWYTMQAPTLSLSHRF
jgi:hypothetical protein